MHAQNLCTISAVATEQTRIVDLTARPYEIVKLCRYVWRPSPCSSCCSEAADFGMVVLLMSAAGPLPMMHAKQCASLFHGSPSHTLSHTWWLSLIQHVIGNPEPQPATSADAYVEAQEFRRSPLAATGGRFVRACGRTVSVCTGTSDPAYCMSFNASCRSFVMSALSKVRHNMRLRSALLRPCGV